MKRLIVTLVVASLLSLAPGARADDDDSYEDRRAEAAAEVEREEAASERDNLMGCIDGVTNPEYCRARGFGDRSGAEEDAVDEGNNTLVWVIVGVVVAVWVARLIDFEAGEDMSHPGIESWPPPAATHCGSQISLAEKAGFEPS